MTTLDEHDCVYDPDGHCMVIIDGKRCGAIHRYPPCPAGPTEAVLAWLTRNVRFACECLDEPWGTGR